MSYKLAWAFHTDTKEQHTENTQKIGKSTSHWSLITCFFLALNDVLYTTILLSICGDYNVEPDAEQYYKTQTFLSNTLLHSQSNKILVHVIEWGKYNNTSKNLDMPNSSVFLLLNVSFVTDP